MLPWRRSPRASCPARPGYGGKSRPSASFFNLTQKTVLAIDAAPSMSADSSPPPVPKLSPSAPAARGQYTRRSTILQKPPAEDLPRLSRSGGGWVGRPGLLAAGRSLPKEDRADWSGGPIQCPLGCARSAADPDTARADEEGAGGGAVAGGDAAHAPRAPQRFGACKRQT